MRPSDVEQQRGDDSDVAGAQVFIEWQFVGAAPATTTAVNASCVEPTV
jgi:hypothetical protein